MSKEIPHYIRIKAELVGGTHRIYDAECFQQAITALVEEGFAVFYRREGSRTRIFRKREHGEAKMDVFA